MATFAELRTRVEGLVIDLPQRVLNEVPTYVRNAHREAQRRHNFKVMEAKTAELVTTAFARGLGNLPANWKEARGDPWAVDDLGDVCPVLWGGEREQLVLEWGEDPDLHFGHPHYLLQGEASDAAGTIPLEVFPFPDDLAITADGNYRIVIPYWKYLPELTTDVQTDWLTVNGDEWIVFRATAEGFFADWDEERGTLWLQRAEGRFKELRLLNKTAVLATMGDTMSVNWQGTRTPGLRR